MVWAQGIQPGTEAARAVVYFRIKLPTMGNAMEG